MQSIDELLQAITELDPLDRQALIEKVSKLNDENDRNSGTDTQLNLMQEAMKDEVFMADLREVMEDFSHVDAEETPA